MSLWDILAFKRYFLPKTANFAVKSMPYDGLV